MENKPEQKSKRRAEQEEDIAPDVGGAATKNTLGNDVDAILDEIDEVLEENAEEFVRSYVQKGGQ